jgi:uncharacterized membrane protein
LNTFQTTHDLGIFTQSFWTTIFDGKTFFNSLEYYENNGVTSHFGIHTSPILFLLVPVYALHPGPEILLVSHSVLYGLGAVPLYLAAKRIIDNPGALTVSVLYFLYPALQWANINEFYEISFLPLLLGFFIYGIIFKKEVLILGCGITCLTIKEDVPIIIMFASLLGLYHYRFESRRVRYIFSFLFFLSLIWIILAFAVFMPSFSPSHEGVSGNTFIPQYFVALSNISTGMIPRGEFLLQVFFPLLFLPLLSPEMLILAIPSFAEILLSATYSDIQYHFTPLVIPPLFFALIYSLKKIRTRLPEGKQWYYTLVLIVLVLNASLCCIFFSPMGKAINLMSYPEESHADSDWFRQGAALIPPNATVSTQPNMYSLFAERSTVIEGYAHEPEYIVIHLGFPQCQVFIDDFPTIIQLYSCIYQKDLFYILQRNVGDGTKSSINNLNLKLSGKNNGK